MRGVQHNFAYPTVVRANLQQAAFDPHPLLSVGRARREYLRPVHCLQHWMEPRHNAAGGLNRASWAVDSLLLVS